MDIRVGKMMAQEQKSLFECVRDGMAHLEAGRFDDAEQKFRTHQPTDSYLIAHGLATTIFRRGMAHGDLTLCSMSIVLGLYEQAIAMQPNEPSPYMMAGMAYIKQASLYSQRAKKEPEKVSPLVVITILN